MAEEEIQNLEIKDEVANLAPFDPTKKKKKKKVVIQEIQKDLLDDDKENGGEELDKNKQGDGIVLEEGLPWERTDCDYKYEELLGRVFHILREHNPELAGNRRKTILRPPRVIREGTRRTVFVNFIDNCKSMHRQPEHVMSFLLAELGTSGSLDGQQRLILKGRFAPKNFEGILRRYVNEYVMCNCCKRTETILSKENRLLFLICEKSGSRRSVTPIKAGFVARVTRRKAERNP